MHKSESVQENKTHKILWDFEFHHYLHFLSVISLSSVDSSWLLTIMCWVIFRYDESVCTDERYRYFVTIITEIRGPGNKRTSGDHRNNSIVKIGQNTKKSPGDLRRLAVTSTPVENYKLRLVWKTRKKVEFFIKRIIIIIKDQSYQSKNR